MQWHGSSTRPHALVDLYVPASLGSLDELQARAATVGLDALVVVAHDAYELPDPETVNAANDRDGQPRVLVAPLVAGPGYRFVLFMPPSEINLESIEAAGDPRVVVRAIAELGGVALPACPRQGPGGEVTRVTPVIGDGAQGVVALSVPGSRLGRDLDLEDAAVVERPILGASGPFASLQDIGRYATLLPIDVREGDVVALGRRLMAALNKGSGFAVEVQAKRRRGARKHRPDPHEGRPDEEQAPRKKRRRRRRKKPKDNDAEQG